MAWEFGMRFVVSDDSALNEKWKAFCVAKDDLIRQLESVRLEPYAKGDIANGENHT